jgi:WD40 repeat protein
MAHRIIVSLLAFAGIQVPLLLGQQPASFTKDIQPFLAKYCYECHKGPKGKAELDVSTYQGFLKGGISFPGFVPGKPNDSFALTLVEGKSKPVMPPKGKPQPTDAEKKLLRDWIAAGAKDDSGKAATTLPQIKPRNQLAGPVSSLAYHLNGQALAAGCRTDVHILDAAKGTIVDTLPEHTETVNDASQKRSNQTVTALAFRSDGKGLAVASGTPGAPSHLRLYGELVLRTTRKPLWQSAAHADIIHDLAFSPDDAILASTGYDRLIKLWDTATGKELRTLRDHSDAVYSLAFSPDGKLLASASADRAVKVWEVATGKRLYTLSDATDWLYAVAWAPSIPLSPLRERSRGEGERGFLAAGGVDKSIRVWQVDAEGGKLVQSAFAHEGPITRLVYSSDGKTLYSAGEDRTIKAWDSASLTEKKVYDKQPEAVLAMAVAPKQIALGRYDGALVLLDEATGKVQAQPLPARAKQPGDRFDPVDKKPGNNTPAAAQPIALPVTVVGAIDRAGAVDFYRFDAGTGEQVGVQAVPADAKGFEPVLQLTDAAGMIVAEGNAILGHTCKQAGSYVLSIRDRDFRGGGLSYRLHVGEVPVVTSVFPLGLQRGTEALVAVDGVHLGNTGPVRIKAPADAAVGSRLPVPIETPHGAPLGPASVLVGELTEVDRTSNSIPVPGTANGRIAAPGEREAWSFQAKKGQRLIVEVNAARIGAPLDPCIEILDGNNQPVPRATLRCLARTCISLRDHDSVSPAIRLEAWNELAINDYILIGGELLRIKELPKHPDADCLFFAVNGQRVGWLDTTPTFQVLGAPVYKVAVHPPGTAFPPNGFPIVTLPYRNDDGGPGYGKDSRIFFDPPADGEYRVRIGDARGLGGRAYAYRLTVRPPRPGYQVRFTPTAPAVWRGGAVPISVTADRIDGFDDAIRLRLENLPPGFSAPATTIPAGETTTAFALYAEADAPLPEKAQSLKLVASALIAGQDVVREASGGKPQRVEPGEIMTTVDRHEITVKPGRSVKLTVTIERRNKFAGRVPLEVRGLPHGVRVLDIGLNGILITEQDRTRTMEIFCEPWVAPQEHPIVVLAKREGKNTEHAARSVLLKIAGN